MDWWWIYAVKNGKPYILGPYSDEPTAHKKAEKFGAPYKLYELPTRDDGQATKMIKASRLSPERISHGIR